MNNFKVLRHEITEGGWTLLHLAPSQSLAVEWLEDYLEQHPDESDNYVFVISPEGNEKEIKQV